MTVEADGVIAILQLTTTQRRQERLATDALCCVLAGDNPVEARDRLDKAIPALREAADELRVSRRPLNRQPLKAKLARLTLELAEQVRGDLASLPEVTGEQP